MCLETQFSQVILRLFVHASRATDLFNSIKVARNEVKNASFAQCSAHRDSRIWRPELIEPAAERKRRARGTTTDVQIGLPRPTDFATVQYFVQLPPFNVWFFSVSRHRSIILAKKWKLFGQILRNSRKCVKLGSLKMLIDHKHASVFFPAVSGKSSRSFSFR